MLNSKNFKTVLTASAFLLCTSCTSWFLQPTKLDYTAGWKQRSEYLQTNDFLPSSSGSNVNYWIFPSKKSTTPKAIILQFHGNAQNISSHFASLGWLADFGFEFITFDYSGYGKSSGKASMKNAIADAQSAIKFANERAQKKQAPLILYGQSLGGAVLLKALQDLEPYPQPCSLFIESSFYSFPRMAQSVAQKLWLFWPFQWISLLTVSSAFNPIGENADKLSTTTKYILHAPNDPVVPYKHGRKLFDRLGGPKEFWDYRGGHISFWLKKENQIKLVKKLDSLSAGCKL